MFANVSDPSAGAPSADPYTRLYDYDAASGAMTYEGWAKAGIATSQALWAIRRYTYNANNAVTRIDWADGNSAQDNVWDNRATLTYA